MSGYCEICGQYGKLNTHHLINGINRDESDEDGLIIKICPYCHITGIHALHNSEVSVALSKKLGQALWEREKMLESLGVIDSEFADLADVEIRKQFRQKFGRSFL